MTRSTTILILVAGLTVSLEACGRDVATCESVCSAATTPGFQTAPGYSGEAPESSLNGCTPECAQQEQACTSANDLGDFEALLTCLSNAGEEYDATSTLCASFREAVEKFCGEAAAGS